MKRRIHRNTRVGEIVAFWAIILFCSVILAGLGFIAGKYWMGGLMSRNQASQTGPKTLVQSPDDEPQEEAEQGLKRVQPPSEAVVKMKQRAATDAEKSEIEQAYPQDAADLNRREGRDQADDSTGADDKPVTNPAPAAPKAESAGGSAGRYSVVAGSFLDAANARREVEALAARGHQARVDEVERDGQTFHRVIVGSYDDRSEAEGVRDELRKSGKPATISSR